MAAAIGVLSLVFGIVSLVGAIMLCMQAWKDEKWKAVACFCCFPYGLYYGFKELQHEKKNLILGLYAGGWAGNMILNMVAGAM